MANLDGVPELGLVLLDNVRDAIDWGGVAGEVHAKQDTQVIAANALNVALWARNVQIREQPRSIVEHVHRVILEAFYLFRIRPVDNDPRFGPAWVETLFVDVRPQITMNVLRIQWGTEPVEW